MKLILFFTYGVSLKDWVDTGLFEREKQLYEEHLNRRYLKKVYWLTYGVGDSMLARKMKDDGRLHEDIDVLSMPHFFYGRVGRFFYSLLVCLVYSAQLKETDVLKTNQMNGGWSAAIAKNIYRKPLIARTGYVLSLFTEKMSRLNIKNRFFELIEWFVYRNADVSVVASEHDKRYICSKYRIPAGKVKVLYNFIDTSLFCPLNCEKYNDRIVFVGRLVSQKNLFNLIKAVSVCNLTLDIFGDGKLCCELESEVKRLGAQVNFMGIASNHELPQILNRYHYYILPSFYEGMPKALLEAMACGLVCIGTSVGGIAELIKDGINGYLAKDTDARSLIEAINRAIQGPNELIVKEAVQAVCDNFSLENFAEKEKEIIEKLMP